MNTIITSILDTDLYKITMGQCVLHQYPSDNARYVFKCRNEGVKLGFLAEKIQEEVNEMGSIELTQDEEIYIRNNLRFISHDYIEFLRNYRFKPEQVQIGKADEELVIMISGPWVETILWEVPLLAIVNELYFKETTDARSLEGAGDMRLRDKMALIRQYPNFTFAEFGTRRRYSKTWQEYVLKTLKVQVPQLIGTSNVKLSMDYNIKPIGTMSHEYISAHLALAPIPVAQKRAMHVWLQEYDANLGIALTDTFTSDAFLRDFDITLANAFNGVRHDSGDPIEFGKKIIARYKELGIDPRTKVIIFSDGLDVPTAIKIYKEFTGLIGVSFGIGTNLTNDVGATPLNIVIKLVECNGVPVVKLSDNPTKAIGDPDMIEKVKRSYVK
jgi:nicotinate phosphoribosyltransferase